MSAMSELDHLLIEYRVARNELRSFLAARMPVASRAEAYERVVLAGDAVIDVLTASLGPLGLVTRPGGV